MSGRRKLLSSEIGEISSSHLLLRFSRGPNGPPNSSDLSSAQHGIFSVGGLPGKASLAVSSRCASKALNHEKMLVKAGPEGGGESARHLLFSFISELLLLLLMAPSKSGAVPWSDRITYGANRLQEHLRSLFHFQVAAGFSIMSGSLCVSRLK